MGLKAKTDSSYTIVIQPQQGFGQLGLQELWTYRQLLKHLVLRRIRGRYRPTNLGLLWLIITPLAYMLIYTLIFGVLFGVEGGGKAPYPIYVYSGITLWFLFQGIVNDTTGSLSSNKGLMNKIYYPALVNPLVSIISQVVDYLAALIPLLLLFIIYRILPSLDILLVPFFALIAILASSALGIWLAALSVNVRDVGLALRPTFRALMYLTPILYPVSRIPEKWHPVVYLNPLASIFQAYRWALFGDNFPPLLNLSVTIILILAGLLAALIYFQRVRYTMVDYL
jgi:lipopolysaccharide transport system permease protein